jgi:hypothetical protein
MQKTVLMATLAIGLLTIPFLVHAEVYKWIDDKGGVHFTEDYSSIPEKYRPVAETRRFPQDPKDTSPASVEKKATAASDTKAPEPPVEKTPAVQKPALVHSELFEGMMTKLDAFGKSFVVTGEKETMSFLISWETKIIDELGKEQHLEELRRRMETNPSTGVRVTVEYIRDGDDFNASNITLHGRKDFDGRDRLKPPRPPRPPRPPK